ARLHGRVLQQPGVGGGAGRPPAGRAALGRAEHLGGERHRVCSALPGRGGVPAAAGAAHARAAAERGAWLPRAAGGARPAGVLVGEVGGGGQARAGAVLVAAAVSAAVAPTRRRRLIESESPAAIRQSAPEIMNAGS